MRAPAAQCKYSIGQPGSEKGEGWSCHNPDPKQHLFLMPVLNKTLKQINSREWSNTSGLKQWWVFGRDSLSECEKQRSPTEKTDGDRWLKLWQCAWWSVRTGKTRHVNKKQSVAWKKTGNDMCTDPNADLKSLFRARISAEHLTVLQILFSFRPLTELHCVLQI